MNVRLFLIFEKIIDFCRIELYNISRKTKKFKGENTNEYSGKGRQKESAKLTHFYFTLFLYKKKDKGDRSVLKKILIYIGSVFLLIGCTVGLASCSNEAKLRKEAVERYGEDVVAAFEALAPGDEYVFGETEQDNSDLNGQEAMEWIVLAKEENKVLLLSKYAIRGKAIDSNTCFSWESAELRTWLNEDFYYLTFSENEKSMIRRDEKNERVSLLSMEQVEEYLPSQESRICLPTTYAAKWVDEGACRWWLCTPGIKDNSQFCVVMQDGEIHEYGFDSDFGYFYTSFPNGLNAPGKTEANFVAVRPTVWVSVYSEKKEALTEDDFSDMRDLYYTYAMDAMEKGDYTAANEYFLQIGRDYNDSNQYITYTTALVKELYDAEPLYRSLPNDFEDVGRILDFIDNNRSWAHKKYVAPAGHTEYSINDVAVLQFYYADDGSGLNFLVSVSPKSHERTKTFFTPHSPISLETKIEDGHSVDATGGGKAVVYSDRIEFYNYFAKDCVFLAE